MKTNMFFKASRLLAAIVLTCVSLTPLFAQQDYEREILVYFKSGVERAAPGQPAIVQSPDVQAVLNRFNIDRNGVASAFPNFNERDTLITTPEGRTIGMPNMAKIFIVRAPSAAARQGVIEALKTLSNVLFAEKQSEMKLHIDDRYAEQWHLNNTGQSGGTSDADIDAPEAWAITIGSSSVKFGVIDTGVETTHDDLTGKSSGDLPESYPYDGYAHGTHVGGIAAAKHGNVGKVRGVDANVLSRPGPRIVQGLDTLIRALHPVN